MRRISGRRVASFFLSLGALACVEGGLPTVGSRIAPSAVRLSISASVSSAGRAIKVVSGYARSSAPGTIILLDSAVVVLTGAETQLPLQIDIAACLADAGRELPPGLAPGQGATTCVLYLTLSLYDAASQLIDRVTLAPLAVKPGQEATTPPVALGTVVGIVRLSTRAVLLNAIGATRVLFATVLDSQGQPITGASPTFASTSSGVVTVDSLSGLVTARQVGTSLVIATNRGKADTSTVTVRQVPASLILSTRAPSIIYGDTVTVGAAVRDSLAVLIPINAAQVRFRSADASVVEVDSITGAAQSISVGATSIIGTAGTLSASLLLTVAPRSPASIGLQAGGTPNATGTVGSDLSVPVIIDMGNAQGQNVASLSFDVSWDATRYDFVSAAGGRFGTSGSFFINSGNAGTGSIRASMFDANGFSAGRLAVLTIVLRPTSRGNGSAALSNVIAGDASGQAIPAATFITRPLTITTP